jgi:site-specific DNA-methyltransferase (adenine-specific)
MRIEHIGLATLYLGDCREIIPQLSAVECVVTSPPYNQLGSTSKPSGMWAEDSFGIAATEGWAAGGYFDALSEDDYQREQNELFAALAPACTDTASLFYNHQLRWRDGDLMHPIDWFKPSNWKLRSEVIWDRGGGMMLNARMFCRYDERILWFVRGKKWKWNQESVGHGTVWRIAVAQNKEHPVAFPVEMPDRCILATTDPGDVVLDPYSGSASTGVAAVRAGRRYIGIEREEKFFEIACRRIAAVTGKDPGPLFGEAA